MCLDVRLKNFILIHLYYKGKPGEGYKQGNDKSLH